MDEEWVDISSPDEVEIINIAPSPEFQLRSEEEFKKHSFDQTQRSLKYYNSETTASRALLQGILKSKCPQQRQAALEVASGAYEMKDGSIYLPTKNCFLNKDTEEHALFLQYLYKGCKKKGCCLKI
jgi:hypothetical protein